MSSPITIFRGSSGLNTKSDPARIRFDPETGIQDLAVAVNVDHDRTGRVCRRKGFSVTAITDPIHSLWCDGGACLFVTGTSLCQLAADYSYHVLTSVTAGARVRYFQLSNRSYWMNGYEKGFVADGINYPWIRGDYVGPETKRNLSDPPIGHLISYGHGRVWVAQDTIAWYSEPYALGAFDLVRNFFPFESRISMIQPVDDGCYFSDQSTTYFAEGTDPKQMKLIPIANYPVIEGTDRPLDMGKFGDGSFPGLARAQSPGVIWTSTEGICVGAYNGMHVNLTFNKIDYPAALTGAALCFDGRYVATLTP
jgi:hypothetical protein